MWVCVLFLALLPFIQSSWRDLTMFQWFLWLVEAMLLSPSFLWLEWHSVLHWVVASHKRYVLNKRISFKFLLHLWIFSFPDPTPARNDEFCLCLLRMPFWKPRNVTSVEGSVWGRNYEEESLCALHLSVIWDLGLGSDGFWCSCCCMQGISTYRSRAVCWRRSLLQRFKGFFAVGGYNKGASLRMRTR